MQVECKHRGGRVRRTCFWLSRTTSRLEKRRRVGTAVRSGGGALTVHTAHL